VAVFILHIRLRVVSSVSVFNELQLINHLNYSCTQKDSKISISKKSIERETQPLSNFKARLDDAAVHLASK
jgi:hypothetical protein